MGDPQQSGSSVIRETPPEVLTPAASSVEEINELQETPAQSENIEELINALADDESTETESSDEESWAYKAGKVLGLKNKPPLINLDELGKMKTTKYEDTEEEKTGEFEEAGHWIGILMEEDEFTKFVWSYNHDETVQTILNADKYDRHRRKTIKFKVEKHMRINGKQLEIIEYYVTQKKGLIAWIKTDPRLVTEIHRRAAKAALREFKTCTFVPKIARERKSKVDELLMEYKKQNKDFRYLVRNGPKDIKVLIKRASEGSYLPYRPISLDILGALTPLKTFHKEPEKSNEDENNETDKDPDFTSPGRTHRRKNFIPKELIFQNLTAVLNGFEVAEKQKQRT